MENIKILLVEDDKVDQMAFKRLVKDESLSYDYDIAGSVSEARRILDSERFDIAIIDYSLGDGTAFDIFGLIKNTPIIIVTGVGNEKVAVKAMKEGACDYLIKDPECNYLKVLPIIVEGAIKRKKAEKQFDMLSHALTSINDSVYVTNMDDRIIFVNKAFCKTYGYEEEDIIGRYVSVLWNGASTNGDVKNTFPEKDGWRGEFYHKRKDGSEFPISLSRSVIEDEDGNELAIVEVARDITERKRAEEALRRAHEELEIRVQERTAELAKANEALHAEISERKRAEEFMLKSLAQLAKKNRYETIISNVTRSVYKSINLQDALENAVKTMSKNIDSANNVSIYLVEGEEAVLKAYRGYPDWFIERVRRIPYPKGFTWKTIIDGKPTYCTDVEQDAVIGPAGREMGTRSYLSMPIRFESRVVGCININSLQKNAFDKEESKLVGLVARQIELAIGNAKQVEALRKSEERQAFLLRSVPMALYSAQPHNNFSTTWVSKNMERVSGFLSDQFINDTHFWASRLHHDDREHVFEEFESILSKGSIAIEYRWRCADGSYHWLLDQAVLVRDEEGEPKEIIGTWLDITDRKYAESEIHKLNLELEQRVIERTAQLEITNKELIQAKEEAEQANRAKSEFLSRMSHELRTPMNAILGFAQLLDMYQPITPEQREGVQHILKAGRHLLDLINEVLDIARIESGHLALSPEPISVKEIVQEALDLIQPVATQRNIRLQSSLAEVHDQYLLADKQRIKQALLNLLSNAVKYNYDSGIVTFSCEETAGKRLRIKVSDTGPGIPSEKMKRLFNPFDRLGAEQINVEGTGLGLALSKRLVEAMGGIIGVESTVGQGSTFWVELPMIEAQEERLKHMEYVPSEVEVKANGRTHTVLYIEDNLSNLRLIEHILVHRPEIKLLTAMQGSLGLALVYERHPDLILLDINLPDISGDEVLRRLQKDPRTHEIPVVVISADAIPARVQKLLAHGVQSYLTKPLEVKKFLNILDEILGREVTNLCEKKH